MTEEPKDKDSAGRNDWMKALEDLQSYDARREERRKIEQRLTPLPVRQAKLAAPAKPMPEFTPNPKEGAVRVPPEARDDEAETNARNTPSPRRPDMSKYEALCKKPSIALKGGDIRVMDEMSEVLCGVNVANALIGKFAAKHPGAIDPARIERWENNLRDTATVMYREFHALRNGRMKKTYDKRHVCTECHAVFMVPLPEGICDECRSRKAPRNPIG
jgi:hypothetical protein